MLSRRELGGGMAAAAAVRRHVPERPATTGHTGGVSVGVRAESGTASQRTVRTYQVRV